jgi:hypothetical protein
MRTLMRFLLPALLCAACSDEPEGPVGPTPRWGDEGVDFPRTPASFAGVVTEPVGAALEGITAGQSLMAPVAWISAAPGTNPDATGALVVNERTDVQAESPAQRGGFDPLAIAAATGDVLRIEFRRGDEVIASAKATVPAHRRPRIVRTSPSKGQRDVALNASIVIVFTEPVAPSSVTGDNITLRAGAVTVSGSFALVAGSQVALAYTPDEPLAAGTSYELVVSEGIVDLSGEPLDGAASVEFSTVALPAGGPGTGGANVTSSPSSLDFGYAPDGGEMVVTFSADAPVAAGTYSPTTRSSDFTIASESCSAAWDPVSDSCQVAVRFVPSGAPRSYSGTLELYAGGEPAASINLSGTTLDAELMIVVSGQLPGRFMMGLVSEPVTVTVTNRGPKTSEVLDTRLLDCTFWFDVPCHTPEPYSHPAHLPISDDGCDGRALAAEESCTLRIAFAPRGRYNGGFALSVDSDDTWLGPWNAAFYFEGEGTGLLPDPGTFEFPAIDVGSAIVGTTVVSNDGDRSTGTIVLQMPAGPFSIVSDGDECSGRQLAPGAACSVSYRYSPTDAGPHTATLQMDASLGGTSGVFLTGSTR